MIVDQTIIARGGTISSSNSTAVNLAGGATFTGLADTMTEYSNVSVYMFSSHVSATNGLSLQQSSDGTNWDISDSYTIPANTGKTFSVAVTAQYFRLVYVNGPTLTTSLRIQCMYSKNDKKSSSIRPQDGRSNENDMEEVIAYQGLYNSLTDTWDRARSIADTTVSNPGATGIQASGVGPGFNIEGTASVPSVLGASFSLGTKGSGTQVWQFTTGSTCSMIFEGSVDGLAWFSHSAVLRINTSTPNLLTTGGGDVWIGGTFSGATGDRFLVIANGIKAVRLRATNTGGSNISLAYVSSLNASGIKAIDIGPAPHSIGYPLVNKTVEFTSAQTGATVWVPSSGKRWVVTDFNIATGGLTAGLVTVWGATAGDTVYSAGADQTIFRGEFAPGTVSKPGAMKTYEVPFVSATADNVLRLTTSSNMTIYVQVNGYEI